MVGFAGPDTQIKDDLNFIGDYGILTRKQGEIQFICDEKGKLYAVNAGSNLRELAPDTHSILDCFQGMGSLLLHAKGSIVHTTLQPGPKLAAYVNGFQLAGAEKIPLSIFPIFQGKMLCEFYNVTFQDPRPDALATSASPGRHRRLRQIRSCLVDARTGLFLEMNRSFQRALGLDATALQRARCEELGMSDLLLLATLNADRKCFFQSQFRASDTSTWFLSETCKLDDRECIQIWSPKKVVYPESHLVGFQLARTYCDTWEDKPERVLICDDNELLVDTCCSIMDWAHIGYDVAHNGKEALQQLERHSYHCVFLDLNMPRLNGFDTARLIRQSEREYRSIPIIAMTATPLTQADLARQLKHFDAILQKPFDIEDVKTSVSQARTNLAIKRRLGEHSATTHPPTTPMPERAHQDYEPTPFMKQFSMRPKVMDDLRSHILRSLESNLEFLETLQFPHEQKQAQALIQQTQSMAISIGAWKLAAHAGLLHSRLLSTSQGTEFESAKEAVVLCIEEALCFYNTVDWHTFAGVQRIKPQSTH